MQSKAKGDLRNLVTVSSEKARVDFDGKEIYDTILRLRHVFDLVRLVDPGRNCELVVYANGELAEQPYGHFDVWREEDQRGSSASVRAFNERAQITKFEFVDDDLYHITVKYVKVNGRPCTLEMVSRVTENTMLDGMGKQEIVEAIARHNARMYEDPVTGVRNRRYYEDHFQHMRALRGVAMIDVDDFKRINDTYGHAVGDRVLRAIAEAISACVRASDAVIRYGGDEFVIVFDGIPEEALPERIRTISERVKEITFPEHPDLRTSVSVGGAYGEDFIRSLIEQADKQMYRVKAGRDCGCRKK